MPENQKRELNQWRRRKSSDQGISTALANHSLAG